jgi:AbiV family abortive infection protein
MQEEDFGSLALRNAGRLLADAQLLLENNRSATALAVAILSIEEVGKAVMYRWSSDAEFRHDERQYGFHKVKQAVASTLLIGKDVFQVMVEHFDHLVSRVREIEDGSPEFCELVQRFAAELVVISSPEFEEKTAEALAKSTSTLISGWADSGVVDKLKQGCLYVDEAAVRHGRSPFSIDHALAEFFVQRAKSVLRVADNPYMMTMARAVYRERIAGMAQSVSSCAGR